MDVIDGNCFIRSTWVVDQIKVNFKLFSSTQF